MTGFDLVAAPQYGGVGRCPTWNYSCATGNIWWISFIKLVLADDHEVYTEWVKSCFTVVKIEYLLYRSTKRTALFLFERAASTGQNFLLRSGQISFCIEDAALSRNTTRFTSRAVLHTQLNSTWGSNCCHPNLFWWIEMMETEYKSFSNSFDLNDTSREDNSDRSTIVPWMQKLL